MERALKKDVILLPGREFMTDPMKACPYVRAAFSLTSPENMDRVKSVVRVVCAVYSCVDSLNRVPLGISQSRRVDSRRNDAGESISLIYQRLRIFLSIFFVGFIAVMYSSIV